MRRSLQKAPSHAAARKLAGVKATSVEATSVEATSVEATSVEATRLTNAERRYEKLLERCKMVGTEIERIPVGVLTLKLTLNPKP